MTRYSGKLVKASSVKDVYDMRVKRSDTLKYKVYKFIVYCRSNKRFFAAAYEFVDFIFQRV